MYDVAHGAGLTALWGSWARYVYKDCLSRFCRFAIEVMGVKDEGSKEEVALKGIEALEKFFQAIHMPISMTELGIQPTEEEVELLARKCSITYGGKKGSAKVLGEEDMLAIYKMAL